MAGPLKYPLDQLDYPGTLRFTPVDQEGNPAAGGTQIQMYLPSAIQVGDKIELENASMNALLGGLEGMITGSGIHEASLSDASTSATFADYLKVAAAGLAARAGVQSINGFVRETTKTAPNPNTRAFFKQVNLRSFQFAFKLIPTSEAEARTIREIVKAFRTEMYPEAIYKNGGNFSIGYRIPNKYAIEAFYNERELGVKMLDSHLESVMTNYNSSGMSFLKDPNTGDEHFSEIDLSLNFTEARALNRQMVDAGGY